VALEFDSMDLFCRINVQAEKPFQEFVIFIRRCTGGSGCMNEVRSQLLDISVFENDDFDANKSHTGMERWLYFRYTLEIDPREGVAATDYIAGIGELLKALWSSRMDAVAACEFEDHLPRNRRRLKWGRISQLPGEGISREGSVTDVMIPATGEPVTLDGCVRIVQHHWPQARFEDPVTGKKYPSYRQIPIGRVRELLVYPDRQAETAWDVGHLDAPANSMLHLIDSPPFITVVLDDPKAADMRSLLESIRAILGMDILNTYAEAP
jgi:hypothetical protein